MTLIKNQTNQIIIATVLGLVVGFVVGPDIAPLKVVGDIFFRLIQMTVYALVFGSVILALGKLDIHSLGSMGVMIAALFLGFTSLSAMLGLMLALWLSPGTALTLGTPETVVDRSSQTVSEVLLGFFSPNIFGSLASGNMVQIIGFALLAGGTLSVIHKRNPDERVLPLVEDVVTLLVEIVKTVMNAAPIGIFALLAWVAGTNGMDVIRPLAGFLLTFGLATAAYLIIMFALAALVCQTNPLTIVRGMSRMIVLAMTTTSSAVTLPTQMEDSVKKLGISPRISNLVNPLGMALNSCGLAMFLSIASMTLLQFYGIDLTMGEAVRITLISVLACLGTVVVPGGGIVALTIVVPVIGVPTAGVALLAGIDWFSGIFRTIANVVGDVFTALFVARGYRELDGDILAGRATFQGDEA